jgi:hypothetical protein
MFREAGFMMDLYDPYFFPEKSHLDKKYQFITCTEAAEHFYNPYEEFNTIDGLLEIEGWLGVMTNFFDESINFKIGITGKIQPMLFFIQKRLSK